MKKKLTYGPRDGCRPSLRHFFRLVCLVILSSQSLLTGSGRWMVVAAVRHLDVVVAVRPYESNDK
jgi:hypothetical protein